MKKIFILTLALLFLLTGCTQSPPPETQASDPTITTASEPILEIDSYYDTFSLEEFLQDLALVRNGEYTGQNEECLIVEGADPFVYIPQCSNPDYSLYFIMCNKFILYCFARIEEDGFSQDDRFYVYIDFSADPDYKPFPEGVTYEKDPTRSSWFLDLGDRYATIQVSPYINVEDPAPLLESLSFIKHDIGQPLE